MCADASSTPRPDPYGPQAYLHVSSAADEHEAAQLAERRGWQANRRAAVVFVVLCLFASCLSLLLHRRRSSSSGGPRSYSGDPALEFGPASGAGRPRPGGMLGLAAARNAAAARSRERVRLPRARVQHQASQTEALGPSPSVTPPPLSPPIRVLPSSSSSPPPPPLYPPPRLVSPPPPPPPPPAALLEPPLKPRPLSAVPPLAAAPTFRCDPLHPLCPRDQRLFPALFDPSLAPSRTPADARQRAASCSRLISSSPQLLGLFQHIPKNAGSAVERLMRIKFQHHVSMRHKSALWDGSGTTGQLVAYQRVPPPSIAQPFIVVFRHPIERLLSWYNFLRSGEEQRKCVP